LQKRTIGGFAKERVFRLLIPLVLTMALLSPLQGFVGGTYHFTRAPWAPIWESYTHYMMGTSNSSGYEGAFSCEDFSCSESPVFVPAHKPDYGGGSGQECQCQDVLSQPGHGVYGVSI
jgi:hypothetical protein